ncbi:hypothetical protein EYY60_18585 [Flavobacterium zhairuonense]|uniref:hypothetical protein n=1 Tax=Flavobacterium zhairuonense TaxID=2493631 RepID=UPI00104F3319|nr:hypothetical protein [Flavobacterium zhairuonense]KAF2507955.1 hypothetical protein EYY60_18585 [Flavobacterium zhairuonense]
MIKEINEFIAQFRVEKSISKRLITDIFGSEVDINQITEVLNISKTNKNEPFLEVILILIDYFELKDKKLTKLLCELAVENWHFKHEDIVLTLKETADPNIVDFLYNAIFLNLEYLEYDETYQLARKCIKAIASINNFNSLSKLQNLSNNENKIISRYARKELDRFTLLS